MIDRLKPYPEYKDSGIPWLGKAPAHWLIAPNRAIFSEVKDRGAPDDEMLSVTIAQGVIRQSDLLADSSKKDSSNQDKSKYKLVRPGDLAYNKMRAWQGACGVSNYRGIVSPAYIVVRPRDAWNSRYFHYVFRTPTFAKECERWSYGISSDQWSLRPEEFKQIYLCVPPADEQAAIVRFLDHAERRIRRYIKAKRRLIALLNEQKQAIIHHAVTRGLDPNVRLKPSGIEWLGDVPENWNVSRVKSEFVCLNRHRVPLSSTQRGAMTKRAYDYYGASGVIDKVDEYLFDDDLLLIAEDGANLVLRNLPLAIIARGKFWVNNHAHILKPRRGDLGYLAQVMESLNYLPWITGAAQPKLTQERLMAITIGLPSADEQRRVMRHVEAEASSLVLALEKARKELELAKEYRTRLISDVVTGKLDVREAAARLPDEADDYDTPDDADVLAESDEQADDADLEALPEEVEA